MRAYRIERNTENHPFFVTNDDEDIPYIEFSSSEDEFRQDAPVSYVRRLDSIGNILQGRVVVNNSDSTTVLMTSYYQTCSKMRN